MYVVTKQQMNQLDHYTMQQLEFPGIVLMENAGFAVVWEIIKI